MEIFVKKLLESKYGLLIFSLLSGVGYFSVIYTALLADTSEYAYLLAFFFFPAIVCGAALCIFKTVRSMREAENFFGIKCVAAAHCILIAIAAVMLLGRLVG